MHEHDTDLIMSLAQGELDDERAAAAEAQIVACSQCLADLELQRSALEALGAAPRVYLTATESAEIRRAVRDELPVTSPAPGTRRGRRRFPLSALAGAAAVLLAIVIAVPALDLLGSNGEQPATTFEDALAPTAPTAQSGLPEATQLPSPPATPDMAVEEAPSLAAAAPESGLGPLGSDADLESLRTLIIESGGPRAFLERTPPQDGATPPEEGSDQTFEQVEPAPAAPAAPRSDLEAACDLSAVPGVDPEATPIVLGPVAYDGTPSLAVAYVGETLTELQIVVIAADGCEVLAST